MMNICRPGTKLFVCTVLALGLGSSNAVAAWFEDFETHVDGAQLQANPVWDGGGNFRMYSHSIVPQYGDSTLVGMRISWAEYGHAYRSTGGGAATGTTLSARMNASVAGGWEDGFIKMGLGAGSITGGGESGMWVPDLMFADHVWIGVENIREDVNGTTIDTWVLHAYGTDYTTFGQPGHTSNGSTVELRQNVCCQVSDWYDVRLTQTGALTYLPEYRESAAGDVGAWTAIAPITAGAAFVPTYFGVTAIKRGTIDEIAWTPASDLADADFDEDGDIDGGDFLSWQRGFGTVGNAVHADGDANVDGDVNSADLTIWQNQFGNVSVVAAVSGPSAVVPEPSSIMLLAIALNAVALRRRWLSW
jgi:hypothetical protein